MVLNTERFLTVNFIYHVITIMIFDPCRELLNPEYNRTYCLGYMNRPPFRPFMNMMKPLPGPLGNMTLEDFDGKRLRKSVMRKTVDYNSAIIKELEVS